MLQYTCIHLWSHALVGVYDIAPTIHTYYHAYVCTYTLRSLFIHKKQNKIREEEQLISLDCWILPGFYLIGLYVMLNFPFFVFVQIVMALRASLLFRLTCWFCLATLFRNKSLLMMLYRELDFVLSKQFGKHCVKTDTESMWIMYLHTIQNLKQIMSSFT